MTACWLAIATERVSRARAFRGTLHYKACNVHNSLPHPTTSLFWRALGRMYLEACTAVKSGFALPAIYLCLRGQVQRRIAGVQPGTPGLPCNFRLVRVENIPGVGQGAVLRSYCVWARTARLQTVNPRVLGVICDRSLFPVVRLLFNAKSI